MKRSFLIFFSLLFFALTAHAQRVIKGTITDKKGDPVIGANVVAKGTTVGTVTDIDGRYMLSVPEGTTALVVSYTGYTNQELALGASNIADGSLEEGILLAETVVTALGISKAEKSLGYSVSKLEGSELVRSGEVNAIQGLAAKSSNVNIVSSSGTPGASSKILLRGVGSFQLSSQPLIVIDNVPYDNSTNTVIGSDYAYNANLQGVSESNRGLDINPADIETINVLKGPSASALYGSRAANGVILITTKKGKKGLSADFSSSLGFDKVNKLPEIQGLYGQGNGGGGKNADGTANPEGTFATNTPNSWGPRIGSASVPNKYDNLGEYFETGTTFSNNLGISGGNDLLLFRLSLSNAKQNGIIPNTELDRKTIRLNAGTGYKKLSVNASANYTLTNDIKAQQGSNPSGIMLPLFRAPISFNLLGGNGEGGYTNLDGSQHKYIVNYDNPYWTAYHNTNKGEVGRLAGVIAFKYDLASWVNLNYRTGLDIYNDYRQQIFDIGSNGIDSKGEIWENNFKNEEYIHDLFASFSKNFSNITTGLTVGTQLNDRKTKNIFARGRDMTIPGLYNLNNTTNKYADNEISRRKLAGIFASLDLGFKNFVYLNLSGRNDWASTFGPESDGSFFYPSASVAVVPSELFQSNLFPFLKLKASYAQAGREPDPYTSATYYGNPTFTDGYTDGISFPFNGVNGFSINNTLGNIALRPELNTTFELGVEGRIFKELISYDFTYYDSKSSDLLISRPIAGSTGFGAITSNTGEMTNKGIELELGLHLFKSKPFNWDIDFNYAKNKNEVTKLANGVDQLSLESAFTGIGSYAIVGQPIGAFFGSKWKRNADGALIIGSNGLPQKQDLEGYIGNPYPEWLGGIRNTFSWKGLSLTGLLDLRQGQSLWGGTIGRLNRLGVTKQTEARDKLYVIEGVKTDGTPNDIKISANSYFAAYLGDGGAAQEQLVFDGSWVRLRELTLSYALPKCLKGVQNISVYVTGRNIWLDTPYPGVDPETSLTGAGSNIGGFDYFNNPGAKSWIFGVNIGL